MTATVTKKKSRINLTIDSDVKETVAPMLQRMGLDYSTAVNIYFNRIAMDGRLPFDISAKPALTADEFFGPNWREGLDEIEDEWE